MNLRTYLRFLRPVRSSLVIALYTGIASSFGHSLFHFDEVTSKFLALSTALPLMLGIAIAGAAHEPMHRAFFPLLPDGPRRLRKATMLAVAVFACATTCAVTYVEPSVSPFATLGLVAGLIALPCIDRHQRLRELDAWTIGLDAWTIAFFGWIFFSLTVGGLLRPAMIAAPWAFLLGGFALSATSLTWGFSRRHLHQRAETLFVSTQSIFFSCLFHPRLMAQRMEEVALNHSHRAKTGFPLSRDWSVRSVGLSTVAWMRVFWHTFAGRRRRSNCFTFLLFLATPVIVSGLIFPLINESLFGHSYTVSDYWQSLAALAAPESILSKPPMAVEDWFLLGGFMQAGAAVASMLMTLPPQLAYPISRERLARVIFGLRLVQLAIALALPATAVFLLSLLGQIASGHFLPGYGLPSIVALDLALAIGLPLLACAGSFSRPAVRILWAAPVEIATLIAVLARGSWMPYVLTVPGSMATALVASANVGLLWLCLRRHYRTCDLFSDPGLFNTRSYT